MNFLTMKQQLAQDVSAYDETVPDDATKLENWLNRAYHEILGEWNWWFLKYLDIIQTATDYTTGTVSVSAGGTTATFSASIATSMTGRFIKFSSADDWYQITAHTAGATTATIDPSYGQTDALSAGTFTIRKLYYTVDSSINSINSIQRTVSIDRLEPLGKSSFDIVLPLYESTGTPYEYMETTPTTSGQLQFVIHPAAEEVINLFVTGTRDVSDMSSDSDEPIFPGRWHSAVLERAKSYAYEKLDPLQSDKAYQKSLGVIENMKKFYKPDLGKHRVMESIDRTGTGFSAPFTMPAGYGEMSEK